MACSCGRVGIFKAQKHSDIVFRGTVTKITEYPTTESYTTGTGETRNIDYNIYEFEFEVKSIQKGKNRFRDSEVLKIRTTGGGADCGNWFDEGTTHLVYGYLTNELFRLGTKTDEYLTTSLCTRTKKANIFAFFETIVLTIF